MQTSEERRVEARAIEERLEGLYGARLSGAGLRLSVHIAQDGSTRIRKSDKLVVRPQPETGATPLAPGAL